VTLRRLVDGDQVTQATSVAATCGIADFLQGGPCIGNDLTAVTNTHSGKLYRLLRSLASVGVLHEEADHHVALPPSCACLCPDTPELLGPWVACVGRPSQFDDRVHMLRSVQTGEKATRHMYGMSGWEYRDRHPKEGAIFDRAMTSTSRQLAEAVLITSDVGGYGAS